MRMGPSARTSATANRRDARISRGAAARGVATSSGCDALPPAQRSGQLVATGDWLACKIRYFCIADERLAV